MHLMCIGCGSVKKQQGFFVRETPLPSASSTACIFHFSMVSSFCRRRIKNGVSVYIGYVVAEIG